MSRRSTRGSVRPDDARLRQMMPPAAVVTCSRAMVRIVPWGSGQQMKARWTQMGRRLVVSWILAPLLVIGAAVTGGYWVSARAGDARSSLTEALDALPADTLVAGFTDWSA